MKRSRPENTDLKRHQYSKREVLTDISESASRGRAEARYRDANRDHARGDRDRTGRHHDEVVETE